jgi:ATP-dependent protease ClpP protease subunit
MIHDGTNAIEGTVKQVRSAVKFEENSMNTMLDIYINAMKYKGELAHKSYDYLKKWLRTRMDKEEDVYFTSKETVKYGFADEIFDANWSKLTDYSDEQLRR